MIVVFASIGAGTLALDGVYSPSLPNEASTQVGETMFKSIVSYHRPGQG